MKKTEVLIYPEFSEYELTTALSILMQGNKPISIISIDSKPVKGESGLTLVPDLSINQVNIEEFDSLLLTGCMNIFKVIENSTYVKFVTAITHQQDFKIGSISSSPALLAKAGLLKNKHFTVGLTDEARKSITLFEDAVYENKLVVEDGNIITARGAAFIDFGIKFGQLLKLNFDAGWYGKHKMMT